MPSWMPLRASLPWSCAWEARHLRRKTTQPQSTRVYTYCTVPPDSAAVGASGRGGESRGRERGGGRGLEGSGRAESGASSLASSLAAAMRRRSAARERRSSRETWAARHVHLLRGDGAGVPTCPCTHTEHVTCTCACVYGHVRVRVRVRVPLMTCHTRAARAPAAASQATRRPRRSLRWSTTLPCRSRAPRTRARRSARW